MTQIDIWAFLWSLLLDLASLVLLSYVFYYRRHNNREMTVAISVINITLFSLAGALASFTLSLGVGFALFSVISIIRLRSDTAGWADMGYLLVALSTGMILGLPGFGLVELLGRPELRSCRCRAAAGCWLVAVVRSGWSRRGFPPSSPPVGRCLILPY